MLYYEPQLYIIFIELSPHNSNYAKFLAPKIKDVNLHYG